MEITVGLIDVTIKCIITSHQRTLFTDMSIDVIGVGTCKNENNWHETFHNVEKGLEWKKTQSKCDTEEIKAENYSLKMRRKK